MKIKLKLQMEKKSFLIMIGTVFLVLIVNIASAGVWDDFLKLFSDEKTIDDLTNDDVYKELILNDEINTKAIITLKNPMETMDLARDDIRVNFIQECGKVNSYNLLINSTCSAERIKEQIFDIKEVCYNTTIINNKTFKNITTEICINETYIKKTIYENYTYSCFKEFEKINAGDLRNIKLDADVSYETCFDGSFGYKIDWQFETTFDDGKDIKVLNKLDWDWWNETYEYRKEINISNTAKDLTDFQIELKINTTELYDAGKYLTDCNKTAFTNSTGGELSFFEERCITNDNSLNSIFWVEVDSLINDTNTTIYLYYDSSNAISKSNATDTFGEYLINFWTFNNDHTDLITGDSGTAIGGVTNSSDRDGNELGAYDFDGSSGKIVLSSYLWGDTYYPYSTFVRFKADAFDTANTWITSGNIAGSDSTFLHRISGGKIQTVHRDPGGGWQGAQFAFSDTGSWHTMLATYTTSVNKLYVDRDLEDTQSGYTFSDFDDDCGIGSAVDSGGWAYYWNGKIDSLRFYNTTLETADLDKFDISPEPTYIIGTEEEIELNNLNGTVKDSNNVLVNNATIIIINQADNTITGTTTSNSTGGWDYTIDAGTYLVVAYDPNNSTRDGDADPHIVVS